MIDLKIAKNDLRLFEAECTLTLPPITLTRAKADADDLAYELANAYSELISEVVRKQVELKLPAIL